MEYQRKCILILYASASNFVEIFKRTIIKNKTMRLNKTTSDCTIYAMTGTAILAISLVMAMYVGNDFHQSLFVESVTFAGSNILLWAIFLSMVNCPYELMTIGNNGKTKKAVVEAEPATEQEEPMQALSQSTPIVYTHEDYAKCVETQAKEQQEEKDIRTKAVLDYVHRTMSRFLYEEDLHKVIEAVKGWSKDCNYIPTATNRFKETVENIPLRHFVWNIAERLGKRDYTMAMRIAFVKALFPKPFEGLDYSTLKNLKAPCSNDVIPIDESINGRYDFHDMAEETSE